ncbi:hypothetical protein [Ralstonia pseudosolanacearum]|uniref:hypothetical protein n=1 Tax=Ralstonia pseudosolanacearum TaxID=1310165 RepID=UPI0018D11451|nr:hypothetical protein [Ralstonia pseudosolanacearum]
MTRFVDSEVGHRLADQYLKSEGSDSLVGGGFSTGGVGPRHRRREQRQNHLQ